MKEKEEMIRIEEENRVKYFKDRTQRQVNRDNNINAIKMMKNKEYKMGRNMRIKHDLYKKQFLNSIQKHNHDKKIRVKQEEEERVK